MRKTFLRVLTLVLFGTCVFSSANDTISNSKENGLKQTTNLLSLSSKVSNLDSPINKKVIFDMNNRYPETYGSREVERIKELNDMNGKTYNLVEFSHTGYVIYNDNYSLILESCIEVKSPYLNKFDDLIYLGASNYFTYEEDVDSKNDDPSIKHCVSDYSIELNDKNTEQLESISEKLESNIENTLATEASYSSNNALGMTVMASPSSETASIKQPDIIANADTSGFNTDGNCGYVAGALLIYYAARAWGWTYLYGNETIQKSLVTEIQGSKNGTSLAPDLEDSLNNYMNAKGATHNAKVNMWHIPSAHTFYDRVKEDKPVALYGNLTDPDNTSGGNINHVVTVYKVKRDVKSFLGIKTYSNYVYTVHYGWIPNNLDYITNPDDFINYNAVEMSHAAISVGGLVNLHK